MLVAVGFEIHAALRSGILVGVVAWSEVQAGMLVWVAVEVLPGVESAMLT